MSGDGDFVSMIKSFEVVPSIYVGLTAGLSGSIHGVLSLV